MPSGSEAFSYGESNTPALDVPGRVGAIIPKLGNYAGIMSRTPDGIRPQAETDAALYAHIAYRLEGIAVRDLRRYAAETLRIRVGDTAIRKADSTAARVANLVRPALRPWLLVDLDALDLFSAIVRLRGTEPNAYRELGRIPGVVHLMRLTGAEDLVAIVIFERRSDQLKLRAQLGEFAAIVSWEQINDQTHESAVVTWRSLAQKAAEAEGLR